MNASSDLEDYVDKFRNIFYKQRDNKVSENDMWCLVENLSRELDISKEHEDTLQRNWRLYLENEDANLTTKYVALNEKCGKYEKENGDLKNHVKELQIEMKMELETQRNEYLGKIIALEENYKREVANLSNQMESERICYETKEKELYNELQLAQASTAIQCDEIESNLTRQLVDTTCKLRQSQNLVRDLQITINSLKTQLANQQSTPSHQKPSKAELKFQPLPLARNNLGNDKRGFSDDKQSSEEDLEFVEPPPVYRATPPRVYKGKSIAATKYASAQVNKAKKKRRLYNPNDFDNSLLPNYD